MITFSYIEDLDVHHYIIHTTIDDQIPFCEYFIVPYLLWFLFVAVTVFYFMFFNKNQWKEYYQLIITLGTGMTLFLIISLVFPNGQDLRPVLTGDSIFIKAVQMIYHTDTPTNVLPSIHVFNSLACCGAILKNQRKYKKKHRYSMCCLNDINYHVDDVLKTTQCGGRSARSPDVYWMLQDHLWE